MRKLIIQEWLSIDGYAADEKGSTDFFGSNEMNVDSDQDILEGMDSIDTILLGASTYKLFVEFWPTPQAEKEIIANHLNETPKIVFSNSLVKVGWGKWDNAKLQNGDAVDEVKKLKQQNGKNMVLWGSLSLSKSLLKANLIDEIEIRTVPIILGKGLRLFGESEQIEFETVATKTYKSGMTFVKYRLKHSQTSP
ncbi:reductase [Pedobacter frigiditerrae]|uniref:Reductase n=1 Tax=Pedobacter frigiditerrae TaxID=2530452 RepID=A0A4R0MM40_9SPHI|nr:dihydrofolate reductase family protein [Pedobacter frigiditerrae]TCC87034.1 reductase [Pedobacter frigiditerrae]